MLARKKIYNKDIYIVSLHCQFLKNNISVSNIEFSKIKVILELIDYKFKKIQFIFSNLLKKRNSSFFLHFYFMLKCTTIYYLTHYIDMIVFAI